MLLWKHIALKTTHKSGISIHAALPLLSVKTSSISPQIILPVYKAIKPFLWFLIGQLETRRVKLLKNKSNYICGANTTCIDLNPINGPRYHCKCKKGYLGNPYLKDGCRGIQFTYYLQQFFQK